MLNLPAKWMSIDPGDRHQGVCWWEGSECVHSAELTEDTLIPVVRKQLSEGMDFLVYEKFALYGEQAALMIGNEFLTVQMIGKLKLCCDDADVKYTGFFARNHKDFYKLGWYRALSRKQQMQLPYWGKGGHVKDAWCLGMYFLMKRGVDTYELCTGQQR